MPDNLLASTQKLLYDYSREEAATIFTPVPYDENTFNMEEAPRAQVAAKAFVALQHVLDECERLIAQRQQQAPTLSSTQSAQAAHDWSKAFGKSEAAERILSKIKEALA